MVLLVYCSPFQNKQLLSILIQDKSCNVRSLANRSECSNWDVFHVSEGWWHLLILVELISLILLDSLSRQLHIHHSSQSKWPVRNYSTRSVNFPGCLPIMQKNQSEATSLADRMNMID